MVVHKYFEDIDVKIDDIQQIDGKSMGYFGARFTLDLQKYTLGRGGLHYVGLESSLYGVVPIFAGVTGQVILNIIS